MAVEESGRGAGAGGAGATGAAEVSLAVDAVPEELTTSLDESIRATAFCTLFDARAVELAVSAASDADRPEPLDEEAVSLLAVTLDVVPLWVVLGLPVPPVEPEFPEMATGLEIAVDVAGPVFPVFVALDEAFTSPELPDWATGVMTELGEPPEPPLALAVPVESPPACVAAPAAGPSRATATAATPVAPAMQRPPASRAFLGVVIWVEILACRVLAGRSERAGAPLHEPEERSTPAAASETLSVVACVPTGVRGPRPPRRRRSR